MATTNPAGLAVAKDGSIYISENNTPVVRKVDPDGIISDYHSYYVWLPGDLAIDDHDNLFVGDNASMAIYKITPTGQRIRYAGSGCRSPGSWGSCNSSFGGDGGPADQAYFMGGRNFALAKDGTLFINDEGNYRVRMVTPDGIISTAYGADCTNVLGGCPSNYVPDGSPPSSNIFRVSNIAVGPEGNLYFWQGWPVSGIRSVVSSLPGYSANEALVASKDGSETYVFNNGRHMRTLYSNTGTVKYSFAYNSSGLLTGVTDAYGAVTTIERDQKGSPVAIVAPGGQRTILVTDSNDNLITLSDPAGNSSFFTYFSGGLLASHTWPNGGVQTFTYDLGSGLLTKDQNAGGGFWSFSEISYSTGKNVTMTTAEGKNKTYIFNKQPDGTEVNTTLYPDGTVKRKTRSGDIIMETLPDKTVISTSEGADPRWGMGAPYTRYIEVTLPSGLSSVTTATRTAALATQNDPFSMTSQTDTATVNGRTYSSVYDNTVKKQTITSPAGRKDYTTINANGNVTRRETPGLSPVDYGYDPRGRLAGVTSGTGADTRSSSIAYDTRGNVASITDPLSGVVRYSYDAADRIITKTLKDGRTVNFGYDANGNVTSIIPPSRPAHGTAYNAADLPVSYTPPAAGLAASATQYAYNLDKQLTRITRPDGQAVDVAYDSGGRLSTVTTATGQTAYTYASSGQVASVGAASGVDLAYTYDGFLPKSETWSGAVAGSVARAYNADFRVTSLTVGGQPPVAYGYDADGLPTSAGAMTITRSAQNGFITGAALGGVATSYGYNTFGELASQTNGTAGSALYNAQYTRDKLGRITQKAETVNGVPSVYGYVYDVAGRLVQVAKDGSVMSAYSYDANGDRIGKTDSVGTVAATYDDQDRLLAYGMNTYGYTANGELSGRNNPSGNTSYRYDPLGNLLSATLPDGRLIEYVVDGANRRVGRKVGGILTQGFLYANQLNPIAELDGAGNVVSTFVYGTKGNVPDYMVKGGNSYRIISDHLGSPRVVVDSATGIVAQVMDYDEFGNVIADSNPGFQPFGFAGGLYDRDTKLTRFGARDYDAETGRWTNKEPLGFAGVGTNFYEYALSDPINIVDVDGLQIDWNDQMISNPNVRTNLERANQNIINTGVDNNAFTIKVTGGDRYRDGDGNIRSMSNNQIIPNSAINSAHLVENGARAVDVKIDGIGKEAFKTALVNTGFDPKKTKNDYSDEHIHIQLSNSARKSCR